MANNPFQQSPYTAPEAKPLEAPSVDDFFSDTPPAKDASPAPATAAQPARRGMAPTRDDLMRRATELGIDPGLAVSFFSQESSGNWNSRNSPKGARGGMQVRPGTYRSMMGTDSGQDDPWNNMEAGLRYIAYGQKKLNTKDPVLLAAGYHAGYDHPDLRKGKIPNTNDGLIATSDYARSVAARLGRAGGASGAPASPSIADQFSDGPSGKGGGSIKVSDDMFADEPPSLQTNFQTEDPGQQGPSVPKLTAQDIENKPYWDRLKSDTAEGYDDMKRSLYAARWAVGGGDTRTLAADMAKSLQQSSATPKTKAQEEIDAAYKKVTDAKGAWNTTKAGANALLTSMMNPKETSLEVAKNAANSLPTIVGGLTGTGSGAAVGAAAGATAGGIGAIPGAISGSVIGGRVGMGVGTTVSELGAEIQDMVQKRLAKDNLPPSEENVFAILNDPAFQSQALKQGTAKGLTIAAVDQIFMGFGGKVATAPAKKVAARELAAKGVDMSTREAAKKALASEAGQAAIKAAKPSVGANVAAHGAAVAVDSAGEAIGEGLSQWTARGEVDYGDALREGVVSIGHAGVETMAGKTIEGAKVAANLARQDNSVGGQFARALDEDIANTDMRGPLRPKARGPLGRAAGSAVEPEERVTVAAPDGQLSGKIVGRQGAAVQVIGDDGEAYTFLTGPNGVQITPEAPNTPLSNALEVAADEHAEAAAPVAAAQAPAAAPEAPAVAVPSTLPDGARVNAETGEIMPPPAKAPEQAAVKDMTDEELRARLKYVADQAKTNGGWNKMLVQQRRQVEEEINARAKLAEPAADAATVKESLTPAQPVEAAKPAEVAPVARPTQASKQAAPETAAQEPAAQEAAAPAPASPKTASKEDLDHLFGVDAKRQKALDRIAAGKAWFNDGVKAKDFVKKNGLTDTHEAVKGKGGRWDIVAKAAQQEASNGKTATAPAVTAQAEAARDQAPEAVGSTGATEATGVPAAGSARMEAAGVAEKEQANGNDASAERKPAGQEEVVRQADAGQGQAAAVQPAAPAQKVAPGTRINGEAERAAADRLEKLHEQMGNITNRNSREGNAKAAVRSVIEELRKEKTVTSVEAVLENAAQALDKSYSPMADVLREVAQSLGEKPASDAPAAPAKADPFAGNKLFTSDAVEKARARLRSKLGQLNSGIDPEIVMDGLTIAGAYIEAGTRSFAAYAKAMADDFGPKIKPYLLSFYEAARNYPGLDTEGMTPVAEAKAEFDALLKGHDLAETKEAIGETVAKPAKRTKKTGNAGDATLTQDFGVDHIDGYDSTDESPSGPVKEAFLKDAKTYLKAVADILTQRGFMAHLDRKGKPENPVSVNEAGPAVSGEVSMTLRLPDAGSGIYVDIQGTSLRGMVPTTQSGVGVMFRAASESDKYGTKGQNRWAPTDLSAADFADMLEKEARKNAKETGNGPQKLDQSGPRELAGEQSQAVQGAQPDGQARPGAAPGSRADARGDERAGSAGSEQSGRVGDDAREVPSLAARKRAGRGGEQGGATVPGGERAAKQDPASGSDRERGNQPELKPESGTRAQDRADGFVITDEDGIGEGGAKTKYRNNVAAIRLLKQLQAENRQATRDEQAVLAKYVGWGGIPQAFFRDNGGVSKGWEKEAAELKGLLTADELAAAASSTRNAHYTSTEIVSAMWDALKHFGFQGGRVLEPSVGVGNFFGLMPAALRSASQLTGVELDHITGGIAKQLYPMANIQAPVGFQDLASPDNHFDVAIGNPPFGRESIYDGARKKISGFSIHNYFFAKSIDTVKPNGVLAMVVTNRLLDSVGDKARQYIAERAEFLGAIRLPNDAFAKNAGTQVTTDIIFLRKLKEGEEAKGHAWMNVQQVADKNGNRVALNEYFVRNPGMMLGEFGQFGSMYSAEDAALVARPGQDTPALLREAVKSLPKAFMDAPTAEPVRETIQPLNDISHVKVGSLFEQGGQILERKEDMLGQQQAAPATFPSEKAKERVSGMLKIRDALVAVRGLQLTDGVASETLEHARAGLNKAYDAFVKEHGPINADANKRLMRDDPTWPQLAALEDDFDKGVSAAVAKTTGEKARAASAKKAAIFFKRTQSPYKAPEKASTAKDALVASLAERGRVDLDYMADLYGKDPEVIARELDGLIYKNPATGWESRDQYLSGNVKKKLAQAIDAAKTDPAMAANVEALRAVQPADIEAVDIDVKTGSHWVPADVMQAFIGQVTEGQNAKAVYNPATTSWSLSVDRVPSSAATQWGTERVNVVKILEAAANQKQITVYDEHRDGSRTLNEAATSAANEKVEKVKAEWRNWIWSDDARRERLSRIYNDTFNTDVQREFDGAHLTFPGKVGDEIIKLRPHQANAVWRMVQSGTTLLDHVVGAGKTFTMIAGIMEMRRMGLAKKPMLVVPNHLVGQWAADFIKLYPGANILAASKKDFEKDNRKKLFARIATGDWDAVIVAHSSFGKVEVDPESQAEFIKQQIEDMDSSIALMRAAEGKNSRNIKQIEKQKANLEAKLKKLFDTGSKDDNLYFSELGVDGLFLDEAHEFKNLGFSTGMQRVAGLGNPTGSNKAADMFMKVQSVLRRTGGRNVVFATGTPISNTMAEMYTMQRYLDYQTLKDQGIAHFDAWAKTFGEVVTDWELSPSGKYKLNSRFAKFVNMPELMQRYQSFADVINRDDINRQLAAQGKKLPVPKVATGKPENVVVARSQDQADYIGMPTVDENGVETYPRGSLVWRSENLPLKAEKGADNMLKIMSDARKAALDMRLINPSYSDNPGSKVNIAADNIKATYDKWGKDNGTQLVFIDLSTPKAAKAKEAAALRELVRLAEEGDEAAQEKLDAMSPDELLALDSDFSVYDDLKAKLIARGIPEKEIAFIHDANTELQKEELFAKVRTGRVRVLFGSTAKMGAGMNVQERLVALHHLDAPWRPSDLEQREGRIIRQGNKLYEANPEGFEVGILRYATKQTLDSRMWQTIEAKARFIEQVRKGAGNTREVEDVAGEAANSAEMKAASSGNPLILEEMSLRQSIRKMENQQAEHQREQFRIKDRVRLSQDLAKRNDREAAIMQADAPKVPKEFVVTIGNQVFDKHGEAGGAILAAVDAMHKAGEDSRELGTYGGFTLRVEDTSMGATKKAVLTVNGEGQYQVEANPGSATTGLALRLQNTVKGIPADAQKAQDKAAQYRADIPKLEAQLKPWGQGQELAEAKARHAEIIEQLKPKKNEAPKATDGEAPAMSRSSLEPIFEALEGRGLTRKRALDSLAGMQDGEKIAYIDQNFWDLLGELEDKGLVDIKC